MASEQYWYSPIYEQHKYGFYLEKKGNQEFLCFMYKNGKEVSVKISHTTFKVLKKEWK